ncbi:hypothetical protein R2F61_07265 [Mollicutes bacterium LVI A0078]|nr:hypothetical protein RZE84_01865 [Mollicutes bacterium LVI A0075]WOO90522.1 hypothetical protein R2F61_07265 [Mollicutes bacterium LVI A0078]
MKELIKDVPKDFINSNKHIRVIKGCLGVLAIFFVWLLVFLYINPRIAFSIQGGAQEILGIPVLIEDVLVTISCVWFLPLFFWCLINLYAFVPFKKVIYSTIPFISLCVSVDVLGKMLELNVSKQYYNHFLIALFILAVVILVENTRIKLVNIATMKRSYQKGIIAHGDEVSVDIVLGKKSRFASLKKLYKPTTYFYYYGNVFHECIDHGLKECDHNELILGTKDAMHSTLGIKYKNITDATIYIPDDYIKSRKYYYGVIRYLEHVGIGMWTIKFAGSNQSEMIKANSILETIKKHDMYLHEENEIMSKPEYTEDVAGIYDYSPFYLENIKLCMEDAEAFARVSKGMSERTKISIEITADRLKREGVTLP